MSHDHDHDHGSHDKPDAAASTTVAVSSAIPRSEWLPAAISGCLLGIGLLLDQLDASWFQSVWVRLPWYGLAYRFVGWPIIRKALRGIPRGDVFNEFFLMSIATLGAFAIGEFPEGVAVMLFYTVGELVQGLAVTRAKRSIEALLKVQAEEVTVVRDGAEQRIHPQAVQVGETIRIKPGEKVALDGTLASATASLNTAALTGESVPRTLTQGQDVLAGMINQQTVLEVTVTRPFADTKLARILHMVQEATARKAPTQRFISRFARVYTPIVVALAALVILLPLLWLGDAYVFQDWVYRSLVFLVISCPCALVVSIPLGYFGGIGAASRHGILFKGANYLDVAAKLDAVVMDKTGTLTKGVFNVQQVVPAAGVEAADMLRLASALERHSTHPIAKVVIAHAAVSKLPDATDVEEVPGHGLKGKIDGHDVLVGNAKLLRKYGVGYDQVVDALVDTNVVVAIDGKYAGYLTIADEVKPDAAAGIAALHKLGVKDVVMLSGDHPAIVAKVAQQLGIAEAHGGLLPEDKLRHVQDIKARGRTLAFVGDGINDAPVVAMADAGFAIGGLGSDATIETADVVIQNDEPSRVATAIRIGRATRRVVWQNIALAMGVKIAVMALGAGGVATLWEAVFADVGVALLAILNAARIQRKHF